MERVEIYQEKYKQEVIRLILDIQITEFLVDISIEEQPDLLDITSNYIKNGGNFWIALNEREQVIGTVGLIKLSSHEAV